MKLGFYPTGGRGPGRIFSQRDSGLVPLSLLRSCSLHAYFMLSISLPQLAPPSAPLSPKGLPACHTHQLAIIEEGEADGLKVQTDLVLSRRLGGEGEAALRAVLTGQKVLEKTASSEHREASQEPASRRGTLRLSQSCPHRPGQRRECEGNGVSLGWKVSDPSIANTLPLANSVALLELSCL